MKRLLRNNFAVLFIWLMAAMFFFAEGATAWAVASQNGDYIGMCCLTPFIFIGAAMLVYAIIVGGHNER